MIKRPTAAPPSFEQITQLEGPDINALIGLQRQESQTDTIRTSTDLQSRVERYVGAEDVALFVARTAINHLNYENGEVVGYAATRQKPAVDPSVLHIESMFVRPDAAGHPLGTGLIDFIFDYAKSRKLAFVVVDAAPLHAPGYRLLVNKAFERSRSGAYVRPVEAE